ncbi:hypothetical protein SteCoe_2867 [Stentor coeruleus]|uniref:Uncharacterized protein n=1 Tax=Stentor coeruleus TaxID=5963 RepID=A0A1R2CYM9_9CILI|nr:hypothetical protein SteCoe_2867 [Stentor coeruleus]
MSNFGDLCSSSSAFCPFCEKSLNPICENPILTTTEGEDYEKYYRNFVEMIEEKNSLMKNIGDLVKSISEKIKNFEEGPSYREDRKEVVYSNVLCVSERNLQGFFENNVDYEFLLKLENDCSRTWLKKKPFQLMVRVVDSSGNEKQLEKITRFRVLLFTNESPPKLLTEALNEEKILIGTIVAEGNTRILFRKVVINEVSSRYPGGCFTLVVYPEGENNIKPLVLNNFIVKSTNGTQGGGRKRIKIENNHKGPNIE